MSTAAAQHADVVILGSGFAGSLTALVLKHHGLHPIVIDRAAHPRFAIGESSTPIGNYVLRDLANQQGFDWLAPLAKYGPWQRRYPHLVAGLKRGFSYFWHEPGQRFQPRDDHANELLVAASVDDEHGDTHWLRADVDGFLAASLAPAGIPLLEKTRIETLEHVAGAAGGGSDCQTNPGAAAWRLRLRIGDAPAELTARFLIDGTGEAAVVPRALGIASTVEGLQTRSRALFTHLIGVPSWTQWMAARGGRVGDHPFNCDDAAQHQLVDGAWMWVLRFNQGTTSVGLAIDLDRHPLDERIPPEAEWSWWMARNPSLANAFESVQLAPVPGRWIRTGRIQRRFTQVAGPTWALLPHTAGFIDPLHSSGIAHSLCGVERLTDALVQGWGRPDLESRLHAYGTAVLAEVDLIDRLVAGCYASLRDFRMFVAWSMLYFAAATTYERRRAAGGPDLRHFFLCADDREFTGMIQRLEARRCELLAGDRRPPDAELTDFESLVARELAPYNHVGLCDPQAHNLYRFTAAPE